MVQRRVYETMRNKMSCRADPYHFVVVPWKMEYPFPSKKSECSQAILKVSEKDCLVVK